MVTLELRQLLLHYVSLRIGDPARTARLEAAIAEQGQQVPVLVVPAAGDPFVLIEGYGRVLALKRLCRDEVKAVVLDLVEADALILRHRLESARPRSALEDGWLIATLLGFGKTQADVASALGKSAAFVSRRLALVRTLPETVQDAVRTGHIGANAAEKFLVPLSRVNAAQCGSLVQGLRSVRPTLRPLGRLYAAWRAADPEVRQRIAEQPLLYLQVEEAIRGPEPHDDLTAIRDAEAVVGSCGRARKNVRGGALLRLPKHRHPELVGVLTEARLAFKALWALLVEGGLDACG
jgi:ParB/RepB/Spo0J family partition protein